MSRISIVIGIICAFCCTKLTAQTGTGDSARRDAAFNNSIREYRNYIGSAAPLYMGQQYFEYAPQLQEGHPYFINSGFHAGSVLYDNILYENIPLKYDLVLGVIVVTQGNGIHKVNPDMNKVRYFTIGDHYFVKLTKDNSNPNLPQTGFYELMYNGNHLMLLKKERKSIAKDAASKATVQQYIVPDTYYYIVKDNKYYSVNKKSQVITALKNKKAEIRQYISKNDLDFETNPDNALISVVKYYETLPQ